MGATTAIDIHLSISSIISCIDYLVVKAEACSFIHRHTVTIMVITIANIHLGFIDTSTAINTHFNPDSPIASNSIVDNSHLHINPFVDFIMASLAINIIGKVDPRTPYGRLNAPCKSTIII